MQNFNYSEFVETKANQAGDRLVHAALGLAGETGEFVDLVKKATFYYDGVIDKEKALLELGDVRFYYQWVLNVLDFSDEEVIKANVEKLNKRYPNGFSPPPRK